MPNDNQAPDDRDEDVTPPWDPETDPDDYRREDVDRKDWYLDVLLGFVLGLDDDNAEGRVGLTVTSNGAVVSGLAISRRAWITATVEQYKLAGADETWLDKIFTQFHSEAAEENRRRRDERLPYRARRFLHMKDVRIGNADDNYLLPFWRGSLADITGWSFGSWNPPVAAENK